MKHATRITQSQQLNSLRIFKTTLLDCNTSTQKLADEMKNHKVSKPKYRDLQIDEIQVSQPKWQRNQRYNSAFLFMENSTNSM